MFNVIGILIMLLAFPVTGAAKESAPPKEAPTPKETARPERTVPEKIVGEKIVREVDKQKEIVRPESVLTPRVESGSP